MKRNLQAKLTAEHLVRNAYLYVRQACRHETVENATRIGRQYALRERAIALGWREEQVVTIDCDLGQSGCSARRAGFQHLVAEVLRGAAGVVMAPDASRLARRLSDWQVLVESCATTGTLLLLDDALFDPSRPEDRLFLGLERVFSESGICRRPRRKLLAKTRRGPRERRVRRAKPEAAGSVARHGESWRRL